MGNENLFAYGTLCAPDLIRRITGRQFNSCAATLEGFQKRSLRGRTYPAIISYPPGSIEGTIYFGLDLQSFAALDEYEGDEYERVTVSVCASAYARPIETQCYVLKKKYFGLLEGAGTTLSGRRSSQGGH